ncbi:hypothetical protein ZIOFF_048989 [Zingiber officinale]|uniref:Uncharacterized protein n=1 Tax=Zingiber officinale TaxID=94328 RepID=A0A8J5KN35_ZINOF|nr:hypothetical protein ZIOFF_048989 [Zingiber officinale]
MQGALIVQREWDLCVGEEEREQYIYRVGPILITAGPTEVEGFVELAPALSARSGFRIGLRNLPSSSCLIVLLKPYWLNWLTWNPRQTTPVNLEMHAAELNFGHLSGFETLMRI